ncbi:class I SAM-dependent RNA methyltransferase [Deinococcus psychrotolerans]|uniref:Class I SAM-dependent RNA methyltransferase n=1 Tax=Deinococcus psychrotolerans TaxID=2489213 RepID=A0A3G8YEK4_9DEIO|nr:methyltransferase domain-containing protein [Deinococcus psychrotolerans]AZI43393.1 class I SAM-dependent RNA methyltransferase [Deinococcus psychrotolerans]
MKVKVSSHRSRSAQVALPATVLPPPTPEPRQERYPVRPSHLKVLDIEKVVAGGLGLARDEDGVVLVRGALGGEQVEAQVQAARGVRQGRVVRVLRPSPDRVDAPDLPTADLAHAHYSAQLRIKRELVEEALSRIAKLDHPVADTVPSPREWHYRNGAQYLVTPSGLAYRERRGQGMWRLGGGQDPLVMDAVQAVLDQLDPERLDPAHEIAFRSSRQTGEVVASLIGVGQPGRFLRAAHHLLDVGVVGVSLAGAAQRRFTAGVQLIAGEGSVQEKLGEVQVSLSAVGFAQVNPEAAGQAYRMAAQLAGSSAVSDENAGLDGSSMADKNKTALDLYGGSGAIGRHLARTFGKVIVLDTSSEALRRGQSDVRQSGEKNVVFRRDDAAALPNADAIVVDPPRAGLSSEARDAIDDNTANTLVYVSCDPATWARDVGDLVRRGWILGEVVPHDFYPQTSHVEVVSKLTRR